MKTTIATFVFAALLSFGNGFAQSKYNSAGHTIPTAPSREITILDDYVIDNLDKIVNLSRKQKNEINQIEKRYDRMLSKGKKPLPIQTVKKLEEQKNKEIVSVLTLVQRQRLVAYQTPQKYNKPNRYNNRRG
jgi:Zn-dependent M32 family carboxypeptidase